MEFRQIDRTSVVQQVAVQLRDAVVAAVMRSSQLPTEVDLSNALMVSRPTLREAIRILETEGLVQRDRRTSGLRPDVGTAAMSRPLRSALDVLTRTERITMAEILDLRLTVEARAAERAAAVATSEDLAELGRALEAMRATNLNGLEWDERSLTFHVTLVRASHNEAFLLIMVAAREAAADILERAARSAAVSPDQQSPNPTAGHALLDPPWIEEQYELHQTIYEAVRDGRGLDAREGLWQWSRAFSFFQPLLGEIDASHPRKPVCESSPERTSLARPRGSGRSAQ